MHESLINRTIIIVGQGICGTMLSYFLSKENIPFLVYDVENNFTASKVASGIINPVTGRRIVKTWMIDDLMPFAVNIYKQLEKELNVEIIRQTNILDFHTTPQMQMAFDERLQTDAQYLKKVDQPEYWQTYFNYPFGIGETNPCWLIDIQTMLLNWRNYLKQNHQLREEFFSDEHLQYFSNNHSQSLIVFCDGFAGFNNLYFKNLPYTQMKGEVLIASIPELPRKNIYKHGINLVPWKEDLWWVGSSYEWQFATIEPTITFRQKTETQLSQFLKLPYKIVDHWAAVRPANIERRPFVGLHPIHKNIGILNGMGTKGCSLAPYFAHELTEHLVNKKPINPSADVQRFFKILSR